MKRVAVVIVVLVVGALLAYVAGFYLLQPSAERVLEQMAKAYAEAQDYTERTQVTFERSMGGTSWETDYATSLLFKRPNKLYADSDLEGAQRTTIVCDGRNAYVYMRTLRQCKKSEAPARVSELEDLSQRSEALGEHIDVLSLLDGADMNEKIAGVSLQKGRLFRPQRLHVLSIEFKDGGTQKLWIGKKDMLVHKQELRLRMKGAKETPEGAEEGDKDEATGDMISEMLENTEITIVETLDEVKLNSALKDEQFVFQPPRGVKIVEDWEYPGLAGREEDVDLTGKPAPDFTAVDLKGNMVKLSDLRGRPVLLSFWDTWTPECEALLPHIQSIHETHTRRGLRVIGISSDYRREPAEKLVNAEGLTFTIIWMDPSSAAGEAIDEAYHISTIPRVILIDKQGVIRADLTEPQSKSELIEELKKVGL